MGKQKSYKRRAEFNDEKEMLRLMRKYHYEIVLDLPRADHPDAYWHHDYDAPTVQMSHLFLESGSYYVWTLFNDNGVVVHEIEKVGASNRLARKKPMVPLKNDPAPGRSASGKIGLVCQVAWS